MKTPTQIDIQVQRGGLDSITVSDDGVGIPPRDIPLACTRFATSKLTHVDDLRSIRTFGFRGEALASASMVARVTITSRTRSLMRTVGEDANDDEYDDDEYDDDGGEGGRGRDGSAMPIRDCAYKMQFKDGGPDRRTHPDSNPVPSAGREGTAVSVRDLFHNVPSRRRALESGGARAEREEYDRILAVAQRYAVHEAGRGVGFLCRGGGGGGGGKRGGLGGGNNNRTDLNTQSLASVRSIQERRKRAKLHSSSTDSLMGPPRRYDITDEERFAATRDVIGHVFGTAVTRELLSFAADEGDVESVGTEALAAMARRDNKGRESSVMIAKDGVDESNVADEGIRPSSDGSSLANTLLEEMMMMGATDKPPTHESNDLAGSANRHRKSDAQISKFAFAYSAKGAITNGSYSAPKSSSAFLLFINDRLVESSSIRRAVESVYADTLPKGGKPFVYLSLELPGPHVDVNVHPTKREVAFLHEDRLCDALSRAVRDAIGSATTSRTFTVANAGRLLSREEEDEEKKDGRSRLARKRMAAAMAPSMEEKDDCEVSCVAAEAGGYRTGSSIENVDFAAEIVEQSGSSHEQETSDKKTQKKLKAVTEPNKSATRRLYDPSRLVRTSRAFPVGALEPFLVQRETKDSDGGRNVSSPGDIPSQTNQVMTTTIKHKPGCPSYASYTSGQQVDMSLPGAFAFAICRCQIERSESLPPVTNNFEVMNPINDNTIVRPRKITPTQCNYESIGNLRDDFVNLNHRGLNEMLRGSTYVGAISRCRSLVQCGIDLIMINHRELAREMFYQIALLKFNRPPMARLGGGGVDVLAVVGQMLQFEEDLNSSLASNGETPDDICTVKVSKTNADLARQASTCLAERSPMLEEYFGIKLEMIKVYNSRQKKQVESLRVTALPILLEGHSPQPHGLPLFLLRLATEVNWTEEQACFKGVCTELASFYSELPSTLSNEPSDAASKSNDGIRSSGNYEFIDDEAKSYVRHTLFPAISYLLLPPRHFADCGTVIKLANLNSLYKVFERC
ncbi:hypothetical protein ACHAXA_002667 [Cyclostephanos tholiformis]|uniref:DNA mismatch repair protein S5 domain-containing protein n=1 Tax=Cyclostephanos tholiformis TaxID=382380 RepID=A0ABD3R5J4_9STRA